MLESGFSLSCCCLHVGGVSYDGRSPLFSSQFRPWGGRMLLMCDRMKHLTTSIAFVLRRMSWPTWGDGMGGGSGTALTAERGLDPPLGWLWGSSLAMCCVGWTAL